MPLFGLPEAETILRRPDPHESGNLTQAARRSPGEKPSRLTCVTPGRRRFPAESAKRLPATMILGFLEIRRWPRFVTPLSRVESSWFWLSVAYLGMISLIVRC